MPVLLIDQAQQNLSIALNSGAAGLSVGAGHAGALRGGNAFFQFDAFGREVQEALPPVSRPLPLDHKSALDQLAQNAAEALFGNSKNTQKFGHRYSGISPDEMDRPMMGASKSELPKD